MMVTRRRGESDEEDADDNDGKESGRRRKGTSARVRPLF